MFPSPLALLTPPRPSALLLSTLNRLLARNPWASDRLTPFAGRPASLAVGGWRTAFALSAQGRLEEIRDPCEVAVSLELPLSALPSLAEGPDALFRQARIAGEAHFAENLGFVLRNLHWDFEEDLAALLGDPLAHRLHGAGVAAAGEARDIARRLTDNLADYLGEEAKLCATRSELDTFRADIGELERDLQRSTRRLDGLKA
ncbi:ubiquinone biosynthesis accessory factor UbiJ [Niveibacterium terrae]|uniref:ubiquinone biosynthesis accessory factor UbiJ n=1 Tax=Niveibacterium terrae TaxID=3373598 RepID=UPI003A95AC08